jgi:hypothetical protein
VLQMMPVAARSKACVCGRSLHTTVGSKPAGGMGVCLKECCVLSGRDPCDGPIPYPEESYSVCMCVCVCVSFSVIRCNNNTLHLK